MTLALNIFTALLIAFGVSVVLFLVRGKHEDSAARALAQSEAALASIPDEEARRAVEARAVAWEDSLRPLYRLVSNHAEAVERKLVRASTLRLALAGNVVPIGVTLLGLGIMTGLLRRERARELVLYSSVTFSYLGKVVTLSALAFGIFVMISPFAPPLWTLYPSLGLAASGAALYLANLPPKL